ncbi:probable 2-oxoglutarate dehydrogenase E1 component DHKTD1, mitochondrial [Stylophora pistillata]|uniref:probable 2-oxoglutarate dehydrogenase E1 component DHKTD1, mitochondrial n=1 Tax=Stylophora pistillata TaxID=50429 RepID=UPI000C042B39|nr:probable 2-oxoglutarate dehydrogenase E1 component DHKTD1, mitochondrial [Stylophora pistillata]
MSLREEEFQNRIKNANILRLVNAYREHGHKLADINPLKSKTRDFQSMLKNSKELAVENFGLDNVDVNKYFKLSGLLCYNGQEEATLTEILTHLEKVYCGQLSTEIQHIEDESEKLWLAQLIEKSVLYWTLENESKRQKYLAKLLLKSEAFDNFLAKKFPTVKRYGAEGAESMIAFFDELFLRSSNSKIQELVLGIPHRGRLNLLTGLLKYPTAQLFHKIKGNSELPPGAQGIGDVLSHLNTSVDLEDCNLRVTMLPNPSHLEAVNPVTAGKARGRQLTLKDGCFSNLTDSPLGEKVLSVMVHGDASFSAQGIVAETFCLANLPHYSVGGTIHLIVNNQLGFTTPGERGRSSRYSSDVGKMIGCPVLHVNGDNPEEVVRACRLAFEYRRKYRKDIIVDMLCYRQWGHNEIDDPSFTQPVMYQEIASRPSVPVLYANSLAQKGVAAFGTEDDNQYTDFLNEELKHSDNLVPQTSHLEGHWKGFVQASEDKITTWDTGFPLEGLLFVGAKSVETPDSFNIHPHLKKTHAKARIKKLGSGTGIDWATAEALAIGSLLHQGYHVRFSGQDVGRGTFSHRHTMLVDQQTDEMFVPLNNMSEQQKGFLEVLRAIILRISTRNSSRLSKWLLQSGLVMLLPHGYDGAGPEHSSCRIERFLQMTDSREDGVDGDSVNMQVVNPTTPAQYFHLLRQQMVRDFRKPLIVVGPKLLLRLPAAVSTLQEMGPGTHFKPVLGDDIVNSALVRRVVFCSGKHYYALAKQREATQSLDTAIIRLESLCPFPAEMIRQELKKFPKAKEFVWSQEEQRNMGAWSFVSPRFENILGVKVKR